MHAALAANCHGKNLSTGHARLKTNHSKDLEFPSITRFLKNLSRLAGIPPEAVSQ